MNIFSLKNILIENIVFDVPILILAFLFFVKGWIKGAIKPFMNFVGWIAGFIISGFLSFHISSYLYNMFLKKIILEYFYKICSKGSIEIFPKLLIYFFNFCGISNRALSKIIFEINSGEILCKLMSPYLINIMRFLIGTILLGIVMSVFRKISKTSCSMFSVPVLSQFNSFLGACVGLLKGVFIIWGITLFIKVALIYWDNPPAIFSQKSIGCTSIFSRFYNFNPLTLDFLDNFPFKNMDVFACLIQ